MHVTTGEVRDLDEIAPAERSQFVPVKRDLTTTELRRKEIRRYSPCGCGSGKKFKFCCYKPAAK